MSSGSWRRVIAPVVLVTGSLTACGGAGEAVLESGGEPTSSSAVDVDRTSGAGGVAGERSSATSRSSTSTLAEATSSTASIGAQTSSTPASEVVLSAADLPAFTTPSGNIACSINGISGASCWIFEKEWQIEMPDGEFCEISDWGNAIAVDDANVSWLCYTDFPWNPDAPPLGYGEAVVAGGVRCVSERTGLTCSNEAGSGFTLARAVVEVF